MVITNPGPIHEIGWKELLQTGNDLTNAALKAQERRGNANSYSYSSAAKAASNLIAVFPVLLSSSISRDTGVMITKAIERKATVVLQMAITAVHFNDLKTGMEFLRRFHQNLNVGGASADELTAAFDRYIERNTDRDGNLKVDWKDPIGYSNESYIPEEYCTQVTFHATSDQTREIVKMMIESFNHYYDEDINSTSLNDFVVQESHAGYEISFSPYVHEADDNGVRKSKPEKMYPEMLKDADVKKMNEIVPTLMLVRFYNADTKQPQEFIIGIKSKAIKANADEIIKKIYNNNTDGRGLVNFIRATTGEISFVKDLLLGLDRAKDDVMSMNKKGSLEDVWHMLQIRAQNAEQYIRQGKTNFAAAITTVVITQEDADYLYKQMNIDINNPKIASQFMKAYNLFGLAIVDDTTETARLLWDDLSGKFEDIAYTMLEREDKDSSYKKVVNLLGKMR